MYTVNYVFNIASSTPAAAGLPVILQLLLALPPLLLIKAWICFLKLSLVRQKSHAPWNSKSKILNLPSTLISRLKIHVTVFINVFTKLFGCSCWWLMFPNSFSNKKEKRNILLHPSFRYLSPYCINLKLALLSRQGFWSVSTPFPLLGV